MKISGIICEYNPLHNGHLYHLEQVRRGGAEGIVAVMSGNFVQRGDAALLDKFTRARLAIEGGVDLVLELPVPYALAPAENFAIGGVALLTALGNVQEISFGSECGDIHLLSQAAQACQVCKTDYADVMDDFLRSGYSYPEVLSQMVGQLYGEETAAVLRSPNNTLAIAYLNAIEEMDSPLQPMTIPRRGAGHNSSQPAPDGTASATYIRQFFAEAGVELCSGAQGDADQAVEAYLKGELVSRGATCDHHHHEEGHSCGDHEEGHSCGSSCGGGCGSHTTMEGKNVGKKCRTHYKGTFNDGTQFDSSYDRGEPLEFVCGVGQMIKGFDAAVADMEVGQVVDIHLMPEEAYGMPNPEAIFTVEIAELPGSEDLEVGQQLYLSNQYGQPFPVKVTAKEETTITFDANHEMAGKELNFKIELVSVE